MAQKLKFGNGTWATKEGSTLAYNDENENYKPLPFSFERDSIATRVNKEGLIEVVGNDIPRIDYTDSSEGALLLENSSTNFITYSEDFSQTSFWNANSNVTILKNYKSPNGTLNASKIIPNTTNSQHSIKATGQLTNSRYNYTIYVKASGNSFFQIANQSTNDYVNFNLNNGTYFASNSNDEVSVDYFGDGWYKCNVYFATTFQGIYNVIIDNIGSTRLEGFVGNNVDGIYIWGSQAEQNSVASSYIPTNGSTVQRAAETANGSGNSEVFNDSEGVLFADISALANDGTSRRLTLSDGSISNRISLEFDESANILKVFSITTGVTVLQYTAQDLTLFNKISVKYKLNDFALWLNGFEVDTNNSASVPSGLDRLNFDGGDLNNDFYGKTKELGYYDTALTDAELETLTSYRSLSELVTELNLNTL